MHQENPISLYSKDGIFKMNDTFHGAKGKKKGKTRKPLKMLGACNFFFNKKYTKFSKFFYINIEIL